MGQRANGLTHTSDCFLLGVLWGLGGKLRGENAGEPKKLKKHLFNTNKYLLLFIKRLMKHVYTVKRHIPGILRLDTLLTRFKCSSKLFSSSVQGSGCNTASVGSVLAWDTLSRLHGLLV